MPQYPLEMPSGLLVIRHDSQALLLDTGSPVSIGLRPTCRFLGGEIPVLQRYQGMTIARWSEGTGVNIDALLGSDVLGRYAITIDPEAGHVVFEDDPARLRTPVAPLETIAGMPLIAVGLAGRTLRVLLHTGATLSCLREVDTRGHRCVGVARDCYPGLGEFTTELRRVPLMFGDQRVSLECGLLPPALERALRPADVVGIVGTNLLRAFTLRWGPSFSELRLVPRRTASAPVRLARFDAVHHVGRAS